MCDYCENGEDPEEAIDAFHRGYMMFRAGQPMPDCPIMAEGWLDAQRARRDRVVTPARPEGYYHNPIGTFD